MILSSAVFYRCGNWLQGLNLPNPLAPFLWEQLFSVLLWSFSPLAKSFSETLPKRCPHGRILFPWLLHRFLHLFALAWCLDLCRPLRAFAVFFLLWSLTSTPGRSVFFLNASFGHVTKRSHFSQKKCQASPDAIIMRLMVGTCFDLALTLYTVTLRSNQKH